MTYFFIINKLLILFYLFSPNNISTLELFFSEAKPGLFVHYGKHQDSDHKNLGDIANIIFIVGKKSVMLVDTGSSPEIGDKVLKEIKKRTSLPISHVVISHGHPDHFLGLSSFIEEESVRQIIGHQKLSRSLILNFDFYVNQNYQLTKDNSLKRAILVLPNTTVKSGEYLNIDLGERIIQIKAWRSGHTDNDLSIYDKKTKTIITENIFVERIPSISASILGWTKTLEEMFKMEFEFAIPGHGNIKNKEEAIKPMLSYFKELIEQVRLFHKENQSLDYAIKNTMPENKYNWKLFDLYHKRNVSRAFSELEWE